MFDHVEHQSEAMAVPVAMAQPRPRIGADSFRALADRLKKPQIAVAQAVPQPVAQEVFAEPIQAVSALTPAELPHLAEPAPVEFVPSVFDQPVFTAPAEVNVEHIQAKELEPVVFETEQVPAPAEHSSQSAPIWGNREAAQSTAIPAQSVNHMQWSSADSQTAAVTELGENPFAPPVFSSEPAQEMVLKPFEPTPFVPTPSPLERILSAESKPAPAYVRPLPEILAAPEPLAPAIPIDPASLEIGIAPPTMEEVTERLKEDATNRLLQLDIENIWRQVLAKPTLEERSDYLREAAEIHADDELGETVPTLAMPEEFDLSRIETANDIPPIPAELPPAAEQEVAIAYSQDAPVSDVMNAEQQETAELARSLLDMMASGASSGLPQERALAADTLLRLLPKLALKPLIFIAQRLSMMDNPPHLLVAKLIRDDRLQVSGPLLEDCAHITDQDLSMVLDEEHSGKRRMIARRRHLSRAIADKLIATKDPSVLLTLVRNANAEISNDGFAELTRIAPDMPDIMAPLSTRADLSAPNAFELFWPAPAQLRRYLLNRFLTDSETLTKILKITLSSTLGEEGKEASYASVGEMTEMLQMACAGRIESASAKIADVLGIDPATVHRILLDREGEAIVVLLKTLAFPRSGLGDLLPGLKRGELPILSAERETSELQTLFDTLSSNKARILLTYWDWAVRKAGPYAPVH